MRKRRQFLLRANNFGSVDTGLTFGARLQTSLVPYRAAGSATPTFTRATTAYVTDFEGLLKPVLSGEARFTGARRVYNLVATSSENFATWSKSTMTVTTGISDPDGGTTAITATATGTDSALYQIPGNPVGTFTESWWIKRRTGTGAVSMYGPSSVVDITARLTTSWQRFAATQTATVNGAVVGIRIQTSGDEIDLWHPLLENVTGQSNQNPSEYVSVGVLSAPYHGCNVDGVRYFSTTNPCTVSSNVVTEGTGTPITNANSSYADASGPFGYLAEGARTNRCLHSQDFSNAAWVSGGGGIAVSANSVAAPDGTTTADTLTASGANGTLIQDLGVVASASKTGGLWLKRKTGTGDIDLTMDGGATWTTVAVTGTWTRFSKNQTLADEDFGIRIVTSGDEVYAWQGQVETAAFLSSDIPTTTAAVTKNTDVEQYVSSGNLNSAAMTMAMDWVPEAAGMGTVFLFGTYVDASNYTAILHDGTNIIARKRIAGANHDATKALTYVAGTKYRIVARFDGTNGCDIWVDGTKGTNDNTTTASQIGTNFQIGADGNGANSGFGSVRRFAVYNRGLSDAAAGAL